LSLHIVEHPLVKHKIGVLREDGLSKLIFRMVVHELTSLLIYEALRDLELEEKKVMGWEGEITVQRIKGKKLTYVPILRAGMGMESGLLSIIPQAKGSIIGFYRDEESLKPVPYYDKVIKDVPERIALVLDPMLATGGTACACFAKLKEKNCKDIRALFLVGAPEGVKKVRNEHPDVNIWLAALDERLNENGYIIPGLGDAGDKIFGTK